MQSLTYASLLAYLGTAIDQSTDALDGKLGVNNEVSADSSSND